MNALKNTLLLFALIPPPVSSIYAQDAKQSYQLTGLPVCYVDYDPSTTITKEDKTDATITLCCLSDTLKSDVRISGRGNYTWLPAKKPFNLKFEKKISLLGMRKGKKYALMANTCDPSMMRIAIGLEAGRWVGFEWTLEGRYVELVVNGQHRGTYFLCERISRTSVPIDDDYGYVLERKYENQVTEESVNFITGFNQYIMEFKIPDDAEAGGELYQNAVATINRFESSLTGGGASADEWAQMADLDNFARWYYQKNLLQMEECNRYYVVENYRHDTPLKMGPVWDFDWSIGTYPVLDKVYHRDGQHFRNKFYFAWIVQDEAFKEKVANLHFELRRQIERNANALYDSLTAMLRPSEQLNEKIWGAGPFWDSIPNWDEEIKRDRAYLLSTLTFLDEALAPYATTPDGITPARSYARPSRPNKFVHNGQVYIRRGKEVFDCQGRRVRLEEPE